MGDTLISLYLTVAKDIIICLLSFIYYGFARAYEILIPPPMKSLKGEVILITGAANGMGKLMCLYMVDSGATLVCWDINKEENDKLVKELNSMGAKAIGYHVDVSNRMEVEKTCAAVKILLGGVTIIINNAGIMPCVKLLDQDWKSLDQTFTVNVISHLWIIKAFLPYMIEKKRGHIVTMCSLAGLVGVQNFVSYCSSKHAVQGYMEALGEELRNHPENPDIKLTTVYPSCVNTINMAQNNIITRFPSVMPKLLDPKFVAMKVVDGMRRNSVYVHIPFVTYSIASLFPLLTPRLRWTLNKYAGVSVSPPTNEGR